MFVGYIVVCFLVGDDYGELLIECLFEIVWWYGESGDVDFY